MGSRSHLEAVAEMVTCALILVIGFTAMRFVVGQYELLLP